MYFIIPLFLLVILGFVARKYAHIEIKTISKLIIFFLAPLVMFYGWYRVELQLQSLIIPLFVLISFGIMCITSFWLLWLFFPNNGLRHMLTFALSSCNSAYFGIPMLLVLLWEQYLPTLILCIAFTLLYENTVGYYLAMRGKFDIGKSLQRVLVLPWLYALILWFILNYLHIWLSEMFMQYVDYFRGAYIILGMMIIGMGIADISLKNFPYKIITSTLVMKIILPPLIALALIRADHNYTDIIGPMGTFLLVFYSTLPMPWNAVALAVEWGAESETVSILVFISTILWLLLTPLLFNFIKHFVT